MIECRPYKSHTLHMRRYVPTQEEYPKGGYEAGVCWGADRTTATGERVGAVTLQREYEGALRALLCHSFSSAAKGARL